MFLKKGKNMVKINDAFPVLDVSIVLNRNISQTSTEELVKDKNVVLISSRPVRSLSP